MYTHKYNRAIRSLVGNYPKLENTNENYKRAAVFRKSLIRSMKLYDGKSNSLSRGVSGANANVIRKHIANGTPYNRNAFTSFTRNVDTAMRFTNKNDKIILALANTKVPVINYSRPGYRSVYKEKEVLLPPGRFIINPNVIKVGPYKVYKVHFTPKLIKNINKNTQMLEAVGESKFPKIRSSNANYVNMNERWKTRHSMSIARKMGIHNVTNLREKMRMAPKGNIPTQVINRYINKYTSDNDEKWFNVLVAFIHHYGVVNPSGLKNVSFNINKTIVSKKLVTEIIIYLWNKLSPKQKTLFKIRQNIKV